MCVLIWASLCFDYVDGLAKRAFVRWGKVWAQTQQAEFLKDRVYFQDRNMDKHHKGTKTNRPRTSRKTQAKDTGETRHRWRQSGCGGTINSGPKQTSTGKEVQGNRKRDRDFKTKQETLQIITAFYCVGGWHIGRKKCIFFKLHYFPWKLFFCVVMTHNFPNIYVFF